jgi:hypothetical protein
LHVWAEMVPSVHLGILLRTAAVFTGERKDVSGHDNSIRQWTEGIKHIYSLTTLDRIFLKKILFAKHLACLDETSTRWDCLAQPTQPEPHVRSCGHQRSRRVLTASSNCLLPITQLLPSMDWGACVADRRSGSFPHHQTHWTPYGRLLHTHLACPDGLVNLCKCIIQFSWHLKIIAMLWNSHIYRACICQPVTDFHFVLQSHGREGHRHPLCAYVPAEE